MISESKWQKEYIKLTVESAVMALDKGAAMNALPWRVHRWLAAQLCGELSK